MLSLMVISFLTFPTFEPLSISAFHSVQGGGTNQSAGFGGVTPQKERDDQLPFFYFEASVILPFSKKVGEKCNKNRNLGV